MLWYMVGARMFFSFSIVERILDNELVICYNETSGWVQLKVKSFNNWQRKLSRLYWFGSKSCTILSPECLQHGTISYSMVCRVNFKVLHFASISTLFILVSYYGARGKVDIYVSGLKQGVLRLLLQAKTYLKVCISSGVFAQRRLCTKDLSTT